MGNKANYTLMKILNKKKHIVKKPTEIAKYPMQNIWVG